MVNIGIIGTGVGIRTYLNAFTKIPGANVKGIVGSSPERTEFFSNKANIPFNYRTVDDLCADSLLDVICIASPNNYHLEHLKKAITSNKFIICEKPITNDYNDLKQDSSILLSYKPRIVVNHQLRFNPYIKKIKEIILSGSLGRLLNIRIHQQGTGFSNRELNWNWSFDRNQGGGVRLAMGSHLIDLVKYLIDKDFQKVDCQLDSIVAERFDPTTNRRRVVTGSGMFDCSGTLVDGTKVNLFATAGAFTGSRFDISVYGTDGELQFDLKSKLITSNLSCIGRAEQVMVDGVYDDELQNTVSIFSGSFRYLANQIVECLEKSDPKIEGVSRIEDALWQLQVLDACLKSSISGEEVFIGDNKALPNLELI